MVASPHDAPSALAAPSSISSSSCCVSILASSGGQRLKRKPICRGLRNQIEYHEIAFVPLHPTPDQTFFGFKGRFWPIKRPLFQGARLQGTGSGIAVCMVASSIPTVPLPAPPMRRHANLPKDRFRFACGRSALGAPMARQRRKPPLPVNSTNSGRAKIGSCRGRRRN